MILSPSPEGGARRRRIGVRAAILTVSAATATALALTPADATPHQVKALPSTIAPTTSTQAADQPAVDHTGAIITLDRPSVAANAALRTGTAKRVQLNSAPVRDARAQFGRDRLTLRTWLKRHAADVAVTDQFDLAANAIEVDLNGTPLSTLRGAPGVRSVQYQGVYYPTADTAPDLDLIHAVEAWRSEQVGGDTDAGKGVKVAVIDSGIDADNACFDDTGYAPQQQLGETQYTNNKVIVARAYPSRTSNEDFDARAVGAHGSHVAGTIACDLNTPATVDGAEIPYGVSGVAPAALLGNYNVFPGTQESAEDGDITRALEQAYADGFDVANMSLGGGYRGANDILSNAVNTLDKAGMVVAVAAGNDGPGYYTVGSPGRAERALTAGSSTVGQFVGHPLEVGGQQYVMSTGDFAVADKDITAPIAVVKDGDAVSEACEALPEGSLDGAIAVISRGTCSFSVKIKTAQDAGATAAVVLNTAVGNPIPLGLDTTLPDDQQPTIPAYMAGSYDADAITATDGEQGTIKAAAQYVRTTDDNRMSDFSSWGPTGFSNLIKPDVVAPGENIVSSVPHQYCDGDTCFAFMSGTSMATPHLAGMAAVVIDADRSRGLDLSAEQVRSTIVNTAQQGLLTYFEDGTSVLQDSLQIGSGLADLDAAVNASIGVGPVSTSFGEVKIKAGTTKQATVRLSSINHEETEVSLAISSSGGPVKFSVSPATVTVPATGEATVTVTLSSTGEAAEGTPFYGTLMVKQGGTEVAHSQVFALAG